MMMISKKDNDDNIGDDEDNDDASSAPIWDLGSVTPTDPTTAHICL